MTIDKMHILFRVLLDRVDANYYRNLLAEEVDIFLNEAQDMFLKQRYGGNNIKSTSFEETQKRIEDIRNILVPDVILSLSSNQTGAKPNGYFYDLPEDYFISVQEEAEIIYSDCNNSNTSSRLGFVSCTLDEYNTVVENPFEVPDPSNGKDAYGKRLMFDRLEALTFGKFSINKYFLTYIKKPVEMRYGTEYISPTTDVQCELADITHREIVKLAVDLALETYESRRVATFGKTIQTQE